MKEYSVNKTNGEQKVGSNVATDVQAFNALVHRYQRQIPNLSHRKREAASFSGPARSMSSSATLYQRCSILSSSMRSSPPSQLWTTLQLMTTMGQRSWKSYRTTMTRPLEPPFPIIPRLRTETPFEGRSKPWTNWLSPPSFLAKAPLRKPRVHPLRRSCYRPLGRCGRDPRSQRAADHPQCLHLYNRLPGADRSVQGVNGEKVP